MPSAAPPPLPASLSSRLQSSIDPRTGTCRHHPQVKLCELVQNNTRWVVRRKICYKCGTRTGTGNGKYHRPGVAVKTGGAKAPTDEGRGRSAADVTSRRRGSSVGSTGPRVRSASVTGSRHATTGRSSSSRARSMSRERSHSRTGSRASLDDVYDRMIRVSGGSASSNDHRPSTAVPSTSAALVVSVPQAEAVVAAMPSQEDFDESDPIIFIPALSPNDELPPPPPRSEEELERHVERLEMRRSHVDEDKKKRDSNPASNNHRSRHRSVQPTAANRTKAKQEEIMPSAVALALLESHAKSVKGDDASPHNPRQAGQRSRRAQDHSRAGRTTERGQNNNNIKDTAHMTSRREKAKRKDDNDVISETSSISTASAKLRQLEPENELFAKQGESEGVRPSHTHTRHTGNKDPDAYPPKEIGCRSPSRGRTHKKILDPEEERQLVVSDPPTHENNEGKKTTSKEHHRSRRSTSLHPADVREKRMPSTDVPRRRHHHRKKEEGEQEHKRHGRHSTTPVAEASRVKSSKSFHIQDYRSPPTHVKSSKSFHIDQRSSSRRRSSHGEDALVPEAVPHTEIKVLAASAARMSRQRGGRGRSSKSLADHNYYRATQERESSPRPSVSARSTSQRPSKTERSTCRSMARSTARSTSHRSASRSRRKMILDEATECCSILMDHPTATKGASASKGGRSRHTSGTTCTQPLSVSSDEIYGKQEAGNKAKETLAEVDEPVVLYKKRARRKDDPTASAGPNAIPMAHIAMSSDEKSHASSISSSSTIEESFADSDDEGGAEANDKSKKSVNQSQAVTGREKAVSVLKDVRGGAVGLASRGKIALGGLKDTSKKWQSALFM
ncbi:hypothetical protein HJC23_001383 [Cyclotella cryptica]|uniref:Uncharacterized protein n=1 Tax=Cyclotella cryptica TaxID=29204 RepID=A0ABD3P912_9STRA|eukprot:CCRYP_016708-RA/>CCRYP_016708-RA protein AED:0.17 eAED:0.17 QI:0/-1/0/1/-1/1/1/0/844